jgi:formylglycine-generating enzyme required for sulfatase activity
MKNFNKGKLIKVGLKPGGSMKRLFFALAVLTLIMQGCMPTNTGDVVGAYGRRPWYQGDPYGMLYIKAGSYNMGQSDEDVPFVHTTRSKTVSVQAFYMDITEISNNEYRQFVYYVRDSIARRKYLGDEEPERWLIRTFDDFGEERPENEWQINWSERFRYHWREGDKLAMETAPLLADMFLPEFERFYKRREIDTRKLMFEYYWIDLKMAAKKGRTNIVRKGYDPDGQKQGTDDPNDPSGHRHLKNPRHDFTDDPIGRDMDMGYFNRKGQNNAIRGHEDRSRFIIREVINVYPDTLCWVHDFTYSFNEPMTNMYFWHVAYDDYPVVGITWVQAKAFNVWRTQLKNSWQQHIGEMFVQDYRLPTEAEWEYAARGDLDLSPYPWGGPYIRNARGCFLGNFKPMRGRYMEDGGFHTVKVTSYHPNDYGLYCMAGNVAEWCSTAYDESMYEFSHDLNPEYTFDAMDWDHPGQKRKVIRGGSWKDIGYYLQTGSRTYEFQDSAKSYVGTRSVMTHLGRGGPDPNGDLD